MFTEPCKTCRHWADGMAELYRVFERTERKQRACRRVIENSILVDGMSEDELADLHADVAFVDTEDVHAMGLFTGPEFGCVHWQPKEKT